MQKPDAEILREALSKLHRLEKFYHYCSSSEVNITLDCRPLAALLKCYSNTIMVTAMHQITHTPIQHTHFLQALPSSMQTHWLSGISYCKKNKDQDIPGMKLNINAIEICTDTLEYMSTYKI